MVGFRASDSGFIPKKLQKKWTLQVTYETVGW